MQEFKKKAARQIMTCRPEGRDVTSLVADAKKQIAAKVSFPKGVYAVFSGTAEATARARQELLLKSAKLENAQRALITAAGLMAVLTVTTVVFH